MAEREKSTGEDQEGEDVVPSESTVLGEDNFGIEGLQTLSQLSDR